MRARRAAMPCLPLLELPRGHEREAMDRRIEAGEAVHRAHPEGPPSRPPPTSAGPAPPRCWLAWRQALEPAGAVVVAVDGVFVGVRDRSPVDQLALFRRVPSTA